MVSVGDKKTAETITAGLLKEHLAACVSSVPAIESSYWWKGHIERSQEILLVIKTRRILRENIIQFVKQNHPYKLPETIFMEISGAPNAYLDWIGSNTLFTPNVTKDAAATAKREEI